MDEPSSKRQKTEDRHKTTRRGQQKPKSIFSVEEILNLDSDEDVDVEDEDVMHDSFTAAYDIPDALSQEPPMVRYLEQ